MPRKSTKTATIDANSVSISEFCASQGLNEQIFRLELMTYLDDADSSKICNFDVARTIATSLAATKPALPETQENAENLTPQDLQPSTDIPSKQPQKQQNNAIVGNSPKAIASPPAGANLPTLLDELIQESEDVIELADLVQIYRNQQIIQNAQTRDQELVAQLRERRLDNRNKIFDQLRDLNSRQPLAPDLPELPSSLKDEIAALSNELGKKLSA